MCSISIRDRVRNEEVRRRVVVDVTLSERVDRCVLRWFCYVEDGKESFYIGYER